MKKQFFLFVCVALVGLLSTSCTDTKTKSGEAYTLKMKLAKDDKFAHDMDVNILTSFEVEGRKMNMNMQMKGGIAFEVVKAAPGSKALNMTYTSMKTSMEMQGAQEMGNMSRNDLGNNVVGKTITLQLNDKNEITDIEGWDNLLYADTTDPKIREQMERMFSKEQLNSMFGMMFQLYPDKPVKVGDTWEKETMLNIAGISTTMQGKYKLVSVKDSIASIELDGKINGKGMMNTGVGEIEMSMNGGQNGKIDIKLGSGYLSASNVKMDVTGTMDVSGRKIPLVIKGFYSMKGK